MIYHQIFFTTTHIFHTHGRVKFPATKNIMATINKTLAEIANAVRENIKNGNYTVDSYQPENIGIHCYVTTKVDDEKIGVIVYANNTFVITYNTTETFEDENASANIINAVIDSRIAKMQSGIDALTAQKVATGAPTDAATTNDAE